MKEIFKSNSRLFYGIAVLSVILLSLSYGIFVITSSNYKASELMVGNLLYGITIHDTDKQILSNPVTVGEGETTLYITISSVNSIASKYTLAYNNNNVTVSASNKSGWNASGSMATYQTYAYTKTVKVVVTNNSGSNQSVTFAAFGGYSYNSTSNIPLGSGWYSVANFSDVTQISGEYLTDIVEEDTNCSSSTCLYGGEATTNYFSFEEDGELYRIIGTYLVDNEKTTKIATNTLTEVTTSSNLSASLNTIKSSLDTDHIYSTNKFNCQGTNSLTCASSSYTDLGILSLDEYKQLEGDSTNSYLYNSNSYYLLNGSDIVSNTSQSETPSTAYVRPTMYLESEAKVTGSGTVGDPYVLEEEPDVNIVAYTLNDIDVTKTMTYSQLTSGNNELSTISCTSGNATIEKSIRGGYLINITNSPARCTLNFVSKINTINIETEMIKSSRGTRTTPFNWGGVPEGIYETTSTEDGSTVYYYSGANASNWVIFGRCNDSTYNCDSSSISGGDYLYWRIIRTNTALEGGGVRLIYAGSGSSGTKISERNITTLCSSSTASSCVGRAFVAGPVAYNTSYNRTNYVGYQFGTEGSLTSIRENTSDSNAKTLVDAWYSAQSSSFKNKINTNAIYCSDRSISGTYADSGSLLGMGYAARESYPTLICGGVGEGKDGTYMKDKSGNFTNSDSDKFTGLGAALITADELAYSGLIPCTFSGYCDASWVFFSSRVPMLATGPYDTWTMSPMGNWWGYGAKVFVYSVMYDNPTGLVDTRPRYTNEAKAVIRPVISLKSSATQVVTGNGTVSNPYIISTD